MTGTTRRRTGRKSSTPVWTVAVAAAVAAALSGAEPTGTEVWDPVLLFVLGLAVTFACARGPRWSSIVLAAVGAAATGLSVWFAVAGMALLVAVASTLQKRRQRWVLAVAGALALQVLVRLPSFGPFGTTSLIAGVPIVLVLIAAIPHLDRVTRRRVLTGTLAAVVATVAIAFVGGLALLQARTDVERGVSAAQRGLAAARSGEPAQVAAELRRAETALAAAEATASSLPARSLRLLPIASQHQRAVEIATAEGARIAHSAAAAVEEADLDSLELVGGALDLDSLARMGPHLQATATALEQGSDRIGDARSGWLLPGVASRVDELLDEAQTLLPEAILAADAVDVVPGLLGADEPQLYFVIFGTPAESREFGGFVGSWATIEAIDGRLALADSGRIHKLFSVANRNQLPPGVAPAWFEQMGRPITYPQNLTGSPDFRTVAEVSQHVLAGAFDRPIDGYVYLDAWALIDMFELTGPLAVPFLDEPLSQANAEAFFFQDQHAFVSTSRTEVFDGLAEAADAVLQSLAGRTLPGPEQLGRVLGPAARAGRLQVVTFDDAANDFLERVHLLRPFEHTEGTDFLAVVQTNGTPSKLDLYLHRDITYDLRVAEDASLAGTVTIDLASIIPAGTPAEVLDFTLGPPVYEGINKVLLSIYTPHELVGARLDGLPIEHREIIEFGLWRYLVEVPVAPTGVTRSVQFDLVGRTGTDNPYTLNVWHQPLVNNDDVVVRYQGAEDSFEWQGELVENVSLSTASVGVDE